MCVHVCACACVCAALSGMWELVFSHDLFFSLTQITHSDPIYRVGKSMFTVLSTWNPVYSHTIIYNCFILHANSCKHTFAPPCIIEYILCYSQNILKETERPFLLESVVLEKKDTCQKSRWNVKSFFFLMGLNFLQHFMSESSAE